MTDGMPDPRDRIKDMLNHQFLPLFGAAGEDLEWDYVQDADTTRQEHSAPPIRGSLFDDFTEQVDRLADEWLPKMRAFTAACAETTRADTSDDQPTPAEAP